MAHRSLGLLFAAILYGGAPAPASETLTAPAPPPPPLAAPKPLPPAPRAEEDAHLALLLPLKSGAFRRHAEAVHSGFLAAAKVQGAALPLRVYAVEDEAREAVEEYRRALAAGARVVVGPLTRSGVSALAASASVMVPTLALNVPEGGDFPWPDLYVLSLHIEDEARQAAQLAWREGRRSALVVSDESALARRIHQAFAAEFARLGGALAAELSYSGPAGLARLRQAAGSGAADMAFIALDLPQARLVRPYLDPLALYATSLVHPGGGGPLVGFDLAGVRFLDMPWMLQPEHPAVMVYPRPEYREAVELNRFYALGIDAYRIARALAAGRPEPTLDGVTGRLALGADRRFGRELVLAQFSDGKLVVIGEARP
ncbi:MAG TPA: penicillin-binding protein activator [Burkholderiales bacterium]|nr:penicillin-binding protein activator [Burkholderiales bacterium]